MLARLVDIGVTESHNTFAIKTLDMRDLRAELIELVEIDYDYYATMNIGKGWGDSAFF